MTEQQNDWSGFLIGQQPTLWLRVTYLKPSGAPEEGWHLFRADAVTPGFKALFDFEAQLGEFTIFRDQVLAMHNRLQGEAHYESLEANVVVDGTMDRSGHVFWKVTLRSQKGDSPVLTFDINEDQTMLWNIAATIGDMVESLSLV